MHNDTRSKCIDESRIDMYDNKEWIIRAKHDSDNFICLYDSHYT